MLLPINRDTEKLYYNQRLIIDNKVLTEPRTWVISKINRIVNNGMVLLTFAQDKFNEHTDYIEKDDDGNVIGMWANYYSSAIEPKDNDDPTNLTPVSVHSTISYSGAKPEIKIGGSYKKFTVDFYDGSNESIPYVAGTWEFKVDNVDASRVVNVLTDQTSSELNVNQIKLKFLKDDSYIGKILEVSHTTTSGVTSTVQMELKAL